MKKIILFGSNSDISKTFYKLNKNKYDLYSIGRKIESNEYSFNVKSYDSNICKRSIDQAIIKLENVDAIIIFNGFGKYGKTSEMDLSTVESMVSANLLVPYYAIHYILKHFIQNKKGHIIVLGSVAGLKYSPNFAMYSQQNLGF